MNRTALYDIHVDLEARMVEFAGWDMPLMYSGIIEEHRATRSGCTMFDVSHMGRLYLNGEESAVLLEKVCTRKIGSMEPNQARYSHVCKDDGGILDDVIVSRFEDQWLMVCNASNRHKIVKWLKTHAAELDTTIDDRTSETVMIAVQGPDAAQLAEELLPIDVAGVKRYRFKSGQYMGIEYVCSRTGYTGEDGFEIIVSNAAGKMLVNNIFDPEGSVRGRIKPAGLGARDTLRLEAAMPLYGHELTENVDSLTAGQSWCVNLDKDFIGADAMRKIRDRGPARKLVGLELQGKRIARQHCPVEKDGTEVGEVTSGTMSPSLGKVIAMAYVEPSCAQEGTLLDANIRGRLSQAEVVPLPFYKRPGK